MTTKFQLFACFRSDSILSSHTLQVSSAQGPLVWKVLVLLHHSTKQNSWTSVAYLDDCDQTEHNFCCVSGSASMYILVYRHEALQCWFCILLCKLKLQFLLPQGLPASPLQTQGFLTTYILWTQVTVVNSSLFLTCPWSVTTFPFILKV